MQPPDELMVGEFLPSMRLLVAKELRGQGFSQSRIASVLGVTQASVSLYLGTDSEKAYLTLARLNLPRAEAERDTSLLIDALRTGPVDGVKTLHSIWTGLLGSGSVCPAHREIYPSLAGCEFCIQEYGKRPGEVPSAVAEVTAAVRILERSRHFIRVMPEVSVNIACAAGEGTSPADVVAVPGRIVKVRDRAKAMLPPEAGASVHMSRILILARSRRREFRAVINLRYDQKMEAVVKRAGLKALVIGKHSRGDSEDPTTEALERTLKASPVPFDVLVDKGGSGIEPNLYVFGKGAREVARLAISLARAYSTA